MLELTKGMRFSHIICLGDLYDSYSQSRFPRSHNILTPLEETEVSRKMAEEMWSKIHKLHPRSKKFLLSGNHDSARMKKKALIAAPELYHFIDFKSIFEFPHVETLHDYSDHLYIEEIYFIHGFMTRSGGHLTYFQDDVVFGHSHRSHILTRNLKDKIITEFNIGYLGDPMHPFLQYCPMKRISQWTPGFGIIDHMGPRLINL